MSTAEKASKPVVYELVWRNKFLTLEAESLEDMVRILQGASEQLEDMRKAGVTLDPNGGTGDDYARLVTTDPVVAKEFGLEPEYLEEEDEDEGFECEEESEEGSAT